MTKEQSRDLDFLLQSILNKKINVRNIKEINSNVFPNKPIDYCSSLFFILDGYYPKLLNSQSGPSGHFFSPTHFVSAFLHDGGFTKYFDTEFAKQQIELEREKLNDEKLTAELDIVKFQRGLGKKFIIWTFVVSVIAIIVSILTTAATGHKNDNQTLPFDTLSLKNELQNIDSRIKMLENKQLKDTMPKY